jgi:hypothetical protein
LDYFINKAVPTWDKEGKPIIQPPLMVITSDNPNETAVYIDLSEIYQAWGHYATLMMEQANEN